MPEVTAAPKAVNIPYAPFPLTQAIHRSPARFRVLCCGRRFGKSMLGLAEVYQVLRDAQASGENDPRALIVAPSFEKVKEDYRIAETLFAELITDHNESEYRLTLGAEGEMDFRSADVEGGVARGGGYNVALLDEAAYIPSEVWETNVRPTLADRLGRAIFLSTPNRRNWFYHLFLLAQTDPDYQAWSYSTLEGWESRLASHPEQLAALRKEWQDIRRTTSERTFRQEWLAEFLTHEGQLFDVERCLRGTLHGAQPGYHYVAGLDVAHVEDWMVTLVLEVESKQVVGLFRSRHRSWALQKAAAAFFLSQYPGVRVLIDSTGLGDPIAQDLRDARLNIEDVIFAGRRKENMVENLSVAIDHGYIGVPKMPETQWLLDELYAYQETKSKTGYIRYGAPAGQHDDGVTALMLACWAIKDALQSPVRNRLVTPETLDVLTTGAWNRHDELASTFRTQPWTPSTWTNRLHASQRGWRRSA